MSNNSLIASIAKIKGFDLNLLLIFEAIFIHKSVSRAAALLSVSPSSVSQSLSRLRSYFGDPLFIREGKGLVATTVAENLHIHLSDGFSQLINSLDYFSDTSTKSKFVIHSTPYAAMRLLPDICAKILEDKLSCEISHINSDALIDSVEDVLIYRKADIVFDSKPYYNFSTITEVYLTEYPVPVCRKEHPRLANRLRAEDIDHESFTFLNAGSEGVKRMQNGILDFFGHRDFFFSSSSIIANTSVIEKSDVVGFIPRWFAEKFSHSFNIKILECDFVPEAVPLYMTYNKSSLKNPSFVALLKIMNSLKELV
ncbi:LysR family transcriptional regulator [Rahnella inusitata]|uniref:LysR family transcriptional regulator n=1 Tax=Rahnella inusitata TaxID=58169 RepID=A0ABX9NZ85_9GAMM|nr:LysR family transcriptional regulator [Rahnella inusitata]QUT17886.1 LysR family transcriptional regulator [Rahnella inusitata]RJT10704.1 LysR family transcriptional regulator [Rahnella inusitata]